MVKLTKDMICQIIRVFLSLWDTAACRTAIAPVTIALLKCTSVACLAGQMITVLNQQANVFISIVEIAVNISRIHGFTKK
jgi:hypothetical protein